MTIGQSFPYCSGMSSAVLCQRCAIKELMSTLMLALQERSGRATAGSGPTGRTAPAGVSAHCPAAAGGGAAPAAGSPGHPSLAVPGHLQGK